MKRPDGKTVTATDTGLLVDALPSPFAEWAMYGRTIRFKTAFIAGWCDAGLATPAPPWLPEAKGLRAAWREHMTTMRGYLADLDAARARGDGPEVERLLFELGMVFDQWLARFGHEANAQKRRNSVAPLRPRKKSAPRLAVEAKQAEGVTEAKELLKAYTDAGGRSRRRNEATGKREEVTAEVFKAMLARWDAERRKELTQ